MLMLFPRLRRDCGLTMPRPRFIMSYWPRILYSTSSYLPWLVIISCFSAAPLYPRPMPAPASARALVPGESGSDPSLPAPIPPGATGGLGLSAVFCYRDPGSGPWGPPSGESWTSSSASDQSHAADFPCSRLLAKPAADAFFLAGLHVANSPGLPELDGISLRAWDEKDDAGQTTKKRKAPSKAQGSPGHIFWVIPAFNVAYQKKFTPLTPREKFDEWAVGTYDPRGIGLYAFESATLEYSSSDGYCGYGKGWGGYGKCFAATEADANISAFLGDFLFPVLMRQDPRYFRLGQGSFGKRLAYAVSRVFVTHADSGRTVFFTSALTGTAVASAASNLYYPRSDRGFGPTLDRIGLDLGNTALFNTAAEFWPEIRRGLYRAAGRH